ncbi:hypothetical protein [Azomonas macrocytogenes]|uniref:DUF4760 domain-containing protein n=1 Tax=Azomonas macrocytogenes TaxID=69962 RepID=A0A839T2P5_AZOMA|nr:hypothetical protein [Azomonas macrocytogenes]MBB3103811.1 hypothetical protein [Azomonas macrocytogenes]
MDVLKDIATIVTAIVGLGVAIWGIYKGYIEFHLQGKQRRAEIFLKKQSEYFGNKSFCELRYLLGRDDEKLKDIAFEDKRAYLTFFEEIAVLKNSGLINPDLTYYMFGYYATQCLESKNFWLDLNKQDIFWNVFLRFSTEMKVRLHSRKEVIKHDIEF